ncbi:hypothetical protein, partial [Sphingomonas sp. LH128]|uniref:hypothetical protein n=1 Tax=Sphingomonas sp. LH128 TaxID=473781 RepID=UPI00055DDAB5
AQVHAHGIIRAAQALRFFRLRPAAFENCPVVDAPYIIIGCIVAHIVTGRLIVVALILTR